MENNIRIDTIVNNIKGYYFLYSESSTDKDLIKALREKHQLSDNDKIEITNYEFIETNTKKKVSY